MVIEKACTQWEQRVDRPWGKANNLANSDKHASSNRLRLTSFQRRVKDSGEVTTVVPAVLHTWLCRMTNIPKEQLGAPV